MPHDFCAAKAGLRRGTPAVPSLRAGSIVIPLVAVSGAECVDALLVAGFVVRSHTRVDDVLMTTLEDERHIVVVPDVDMVRPDDLVVLLRTAGVAYSDFLDYLSEAPTAPDPLGQTRRLRKVRLGEEPPQGATG